MSWWFAKSQVKRETELRVIFAVGNDTKEVVLDTNGDGGGAARDVFAVRSAVKGLLTKGDPDDEFYVFRKLNDKCVVWYYALELVQTGYITRCILTGYDDGQFTSFPGNEVTIQDMLQLLQEPIAAASNIASNNNNTLNEDSPPPRRLERVDGRTPPAPKKAKRNPVRKGRKLF